MEFLLIIFMNCLCFVFLRDDVEMIHSSKFWSLNFQQEIRTSELACKQDILKSESYKLEFRRSLDGFRLQDKEKN
jgi:hypothetical protein